MKRFTYLLLFIFLNLAFSHAFGRDGDDNHKSCHNDCSHTTCGHVNCSHNSCKNDCNHTNCGHPNCSHNSCKNDCTHTSCGHPNCSHNSCKNDCNHTSCGHPNCSHNKCKNDCNHTNCGHPNCSHNSCKNDCNHTSCGHPNCSHNSCKNDCKHTGCGHPNCGHNSCKNDCNHAGCGHPNCSHNSCKNDCKHTGCGHPNCGHNNCHNDCDHSGCGHQNCGKLRLGNQVWNDRDGDGKRDENEPAIGGVTISLYTDNNSDNLPDGPAIRTTQSDVQGHYLFTGLQAGRYIASMPIIPGYQQSPNNTTGGIVGAPQPGCCSLTPDADVDNDNNLVRLVGPNAPGGIVYTNAITLSAGQEPTNDGDDANGNLTLDLAECGNSGIGDFVWNDLNGNGIQDAGEPGINDVLVTITFEDGRTASVLTHTYNAPNNANAPQYDGYYDFINLGPGTYKITFATPAGLHASPSNVGDDAKDSDPVNGGPVSVTIAANQSNFTIDAGFTNVSPPPPPSTCPNLSLGNMVFNDANGNGVRDANEQGIAGLTVKLYADNDGNNVPDGAAISTLMTAADGTYYFGNLAAGKYIVGVTTGSTYTQNPVADATPDDNKDNDNNGVRTVSGEVRSNYITLSAGDEPINDGSDNNSNLTLDFGLKSLCGTHCDCHNDCTHTGCGHPNCGHNSCKNDCKHTNCGHPNCAHNSCKNDCDHKDCGHPNCGHNSCKNDCNHKNCGHPNCAHNSCKNDCDHKDCGHSNCGKKSGNKVDEDAKTEVSVYPNPATDHCQVKVNAIKSGTGQIRITDASGHVVASKEVKINAGSNTITFGDLGNLKSGNYNVQLLFDYHVYNEKLMIVK